ncbi:unnamed protein product [marine sediment metagenome]|uniref:Uncharacterized protein n=1 Tax=marine sediment metagenome TaxID=412755 RepID=X1PF95_9ZZZZ
MNDKQMKLFGADAKPKSVIEANEQGKVGTVDAPKPAKKMDPRSCPECFMMMRPQTDATHLQVCSQCNVGYNVNYDPPQIYYEGGKHAPICRAESIGSQDV